MQGKTTKQVLNQNSELNQIRNMNLQSACKNSNYVYGPYDDMNIKF